MGYLPYQLVISGFLNHQHLWIYGFFHSMAAWWNHLENDGSQVVNGASLLTNNTALLYGGSATSTSPTTNTFCHPKKWSKKWGLIRWQAVCFMFRTTFPKELSAGSLFNKLMNSRTLMAITDTVCVVPWYLLRSKHPEILQEATLFVASPHVTRFEWSGIWIWSGACKVFTIRQFYKSLVARKVSFFEPLYQVLLLILVW